MDEFLPILLDSVELNFRTAADRRGASVTNARTAKPSVPHGYGRAFTASRVQSAQFVACVCGRRTVIRVRLGVSRIVGEPVGRVVSSRGLFEQRRERLEMLCDQTLDVIADGMEARQFLVLNLVLIDAEPDNFARLEAVDMFTRLMHRASAGRR